MLDSLKQDIKYGVRTLACSPGFTAAAVVSLALGIGANTAMFTLTNAVFLKPLPVEDPSHVIQVYTVDHATVTTSSNLTRTPMSWLNYQDFRGQNDVFTGMAAYFPFGVTFSGIGDPKPQPAQIVSANYFDVLGVKPMLGRTFRPEEDKTPGGNAVAVISHGFWLRNFGGRPDAIGQAINLNLVPYTVIGVAPPDFKGTLAVSPPDTVWFPLSMHSQALPAPIEALFNERRFRVVSAFGRLKPGLTQGQALASLQTIASRLEQEYPKANRGRGVEVSTLTEAGLGFLPRAQMVVAAIALTTVVALVLLIACANLANLLLARAAKRAKEMGIRTAMGAERGRLVRQLLTESLMLATAGGLGGLAVGWAGCKLLWSFRPPFLGANSISLDMDGRVFAFTALAALITGLLFGLAPALRASAADLNSLLKAGGRGGTENWSSVLRGALVVGQVSLALVALVGAGLFVRSMRKVELISPGFETRSLFLFGFDVSSRRYAPERTDQFFDTVLDKVRALPGVRAVALSSGPPLLGGLLATLLKEGEQLGPGHSGTLTVLNTVTPGYFDTLRVPLLAGRPLNDFDRANTRPVAIVSAAMARHFWPGETAIGKRFHTAINTRNIEVVGIAADTAVTNIGEQPQPLAYFPQRQSPSAAMTLLVRTSGDPATVLPRALAEVHGLDRNLALVAPLTMPQLIAQGLWAPRMGAALFGIFGLLGMALAAVGIYGVIAYMVTQRTSEIGIRVALGARPGDVQRMIVGQSMRLALAGIGLGVLLALAVTRLTASLLFGVTAYDPLTFAVVIAAIAGAALLAGWLPALRAARIDPLLALRQD